MTFHKLSAGPGYEYLTRQVAALDSTEMGSMPLADYYSVKGEAPGRWVGSGLVGVDGLEVGDVVTAEQMKLLFGTGAHPVTGEQLGSAYKVYRNEAVDEFNQEVARRIGATGASTGVSTGARPPLDLLARARSEVAAEWFARDHGRAPSGARELSDALRRYARPRQTTVAGYDLSFSSVKSVSALWAVAPVEIAHVIEAAHDAAVCEALAFIEREVLFTREGRNGARQVETRGLIATAFTHRDSRAGDPDLHTHVAVANKVEAREGKWLAIFGTPLHENIVATSETYNTALELRLTEALGVRFVERPRTAGDKRPVREIEGFSPELCARWSQRRASIVARQRELARDFQRDHGRPPASTESVALAQQANLETREAKHEPRSEAEQRKAWRAEAVKVLGSAKAVADMVEVSLRRGARDTRPPVSMDWVRATAAVVVGGLESRRAVWQIQWVVDAVLETCVNLSPDLDPIGEPAVLRRSSGESVYRHTGRDRYTSTRILDAEQRIVAAAGLVDGFAWECDDVELSILAAPLDDVPLNRGQEGLVVAMATSPARVQLALAPAGSGKTTAMLVLANVWKDGGLPTLGLAPSAAAAAALAEATGMECETLAKLDHDLVHSPGSALVASIRPGTLVVIDEAGMADTLTLYRVISHAVAQGAVVRLLGDDQQLAAIGAGGVLRDIAATHGALRLDELVRFTDPVEAAASLDLREGSVAALGFYLDHDRVHVGSVDACVEEVFTAWQRERAGGRDCLMLAPTRDLVRSLNLSTQASRGLSGRSVSLADECVAYARDVVITRRNDRRLTTSGTDWVKNGDRWIVDRIDHGALHVRHQRSGLHATLPASYVKEHVELGYAYTVHTAQGLTADVMHGIVTGTETRQTLYTMLTRSRVENHVHVILGASEVHAVPSPSFEGAATVTELLESIVARDGAAESATSVRVAAASVEAQLRDAVSRYADALALAASRLHVSLDDALVGPLPWLARIPDEVTASSWGSYLAARARRVSTLAASVRASVTLPDWTLRYDDVIDPELRADLAVWRAARGIKADDKSLTGLVPDDDRQSAYHQHLNRTLHARYGEAIGAWERKVLDYTGRRDDQTAALAKQLDSLARAGRDAERLLDLAAARKPLPVDHPTSALAYRIKELTTLKRQRRATPSMDPHPRPSQQQAGPSLGM